ncbi:hypothetical protein BJX70DRAFT_399657 [Aspergillus crustosus]
MAALTLGVVPAETILDIADHLDVTSLNSLLQTGQRFHRLLQQRLHKLARTYRNVPGAGTPLIWAAQHRTTPLLCKLLDGDRWPSDHEKGTTALHQAVLLENETALRLLLDAGADTLTEVSAGNTALMMAVKVGNEKAIRHIVDVQMRKYSWHDI